MMMLLQAIRGKLKKGFVGPSGSPYFLFGFIAVIIFLAFISSFKQQISMDSGSIVIDMSISAGGQANLWINDQSKPPLTAKTFPNDRQRYKFLGLTEDIAYLRLDPAPGIEGQTIRIYGIEINSPNGDIKKIDPKEISVWKTYGGSGGKLFPDFIEFTSGGNTSIVSDGYYPLATFYPKLIHKFSGLINNISDINIVLEIFLFCMILLSTKSKYPAHLLILACLLVCFTVFTKFIAQVKFGDIAVNKAVGLAAFSGNTLIPNKIFWAASLFLSILIALLSARYFKKYYEDSLGIKNTHDFRCSWYGIILVFIWASIFLFPDTQGLVPRHSIVWGGMYVPNWDSDNAVTWAYMIKNGLIPFKDFWYPYAFSYLFDAYQPLGAILQYLITTSLLMAIFFLVSVIGNKNYWAGFFAVVIILLGWMPQQGVLIFPQPERHLFPFAIALSYLIGSRFENKGRLIYLFWTILSVALLLEPSQVMYAMPALLIILSMNLIEKKNISRVNKLKIILLEMSFPVIISIIFLIFIYRAEAIKNVSDLYLEMGAISSYMAIPTGIDMRLKNYEDFKFILILGPFILFSLGLYEYLLKNKKYINLSKAMIVVCIIGIFQLQKHLVRPTDWTLFYSSFFGFLFYALILAKREKLKFISAYNGMVCGVILIILINNGAIKYIQDRFFSINSRIISAFKILNSTTQEISEYRNNQFSMEKFKAYGEEIQILEELKNITHENSNFYSLPDNPVLYIISNKTPPYQINGFSLSPIFEQRRIINNLINNKIEYIIFDTNKSTIDGFSYAVRLPIVYEFIVKNYNPIFNSGRYYIFQLKNSKDKSDLSKWQLVLGSTVDLGYIPNYSKFQINNKECELNCQYYLEINVNVKNEMPISIPLTIKGKEFRINFIATPSRKVYIIEMSRIWFWALVDHYNGDVDFKEIHKENFDAKLIRLESKPDVLY